MKDFIEDNRNRSYDNDLREAYNKEEALKDQYFSDGQREGRVQGQKEEKSEIARKMLAEKIDISLISKITA